MRWISAGIAAILKWMRGLFVRPKLSTIPDNMSSPNLQPPLVPAEFDIAAAKLRYLQDSVVQQAQADLAELVKGKTFASADTVR